MWRPLLWMGVVTAVSGIDGSLPPPESSYNILVLIPATGRSHWKIFQPLLQALAERGHQIVTLQSLPAAHTHCNITEIVLQLGPTKPSSRFGGLKDLTGGLNTMEGPLTSAAANFYRIPGVKEIFNKRKEFDLIIIDHMFNEMAYPFAAGMPFITLAVPGLEPQQSAVLGNVLHPAYAPGILFDYPRPLSFTNRLRNLFHHVYLASYWRLWGVIPKLQKLASTHFPDLPSLLDIERNVSLTLVNSDVSFGYSLPLLPSQVQVGGIHCVPGQPLPQELEEWVAGAGTEGVIYFSLGTIALGTTIPTAYKILFIKAFSQLNYRVIWKYESVLEGAPSNVLTSSFLPQQDILADPRVKLFISHGGLLSTQEAIYHAKPILTLPIFGDQPKNALSIVRQGFGLSLDWDSLTVELIVNTVKEVINNTKYKQKVRETSAVFRDQPQSPVERAVFWTEYVVRHAGAAHLRSPAAQLTWVQFLMLDVLLYLHLAAILTFFILRRILKAVTRFFIHTFHKRKVD